MQRQSSTPTLSSSATSFDGIWTANARFQIVGTAKRLSSRALLMQEDCLRVLARLPDNCVDSIVTDPPYHLTSIVKRFGSASAKAAKNYAGERPGATGAYARVSSGFMGKVWDGGDIAFRAETWGEMLRVLKPGGLLLAFAAPRNQHRMICAIDDAGFEVRDLIMWVYGQGWPKRKTLLKPAFEPICFAQKPFKGSVEANYEMHGVGAINVEGCRIEGNTSVSREGEASRERRYTNAGSTNFAMTPGPRGGDPRGRWPANFIHDGDEEVLALLPRQAARFFYCAKATERDRAGSTHPTVKPLALMRYLTRLVTPPGGVVLDPFAGSGSTGQAALEEGFRAVMIESDEGHAAGIVRRISQMSTRRNVL